MLSDAKVTHPHRRRRRKSKIRWPGGRSLRPQKRYALWRHSLIRSKEHYAALRLKIPMYLRMLTTSRPMRATMTHHRRKLLASANGSSGSSHDFIASHGLPASPVIPGLAALAVMANACIPAHFSSSALVAGQILDSGRDLTQVPPGIFEELRLSEFRVELFPPPPSLGGTGS